MKQLSGRVSLSLVSVLLVVLFGAALAACGDDTATATTQITTPTVAPSPTPTPDPKSIAKGAADKLQTLSTFHFAIKVTGSPILIPGVALSSADGDLVKPDRVKANMGVLVGGAFKIQSQAIGIGADTYFNNPLSKKWEKMPASWGFKPQILFDPDQGISGVVSRIDNLTLVGSDTVDSVDSWHLAGIVTGKDVGPLSANTLGKYPVNFDVWVGKSDSIVRKITMKEIVPGVTPGTTPAAGTPVPSEWLITLSNFNEQVDIQKPDGVA